MSHRPGPHTFSPQGAFRSYGFPLCLCLRPVAQADSDLQVSESERTLLLSSREQAAVLPFPVIGGGVPILLLVDLTAPPHGPGRKALGHVHKLQPPPRPNR